MNVKNVNDKLGPIQSELPRILNQISDKEKAFQGQSNYEEKSRPFSELERNSL